MFWGDEQWLMCDRQARMFQILICWFHVCLRRLMPITYKEIYIMDHYGTTNYKSCQASGKIPVTLWKFFQWFPCEFENAQGISIPMSYLPTPSSLAKPGLCSVKCRQLLWWPLVACTLDEILTNHAFSSTQYESLTPGFCLPLFALQTQNMHPWFSLTLWEFDRLQMAHLEMAHFDLLNLVSCHGYV